MGIFDKITEAQSTTQGVYFLPGNYLVRIKKCKAITTREQGGAFVVEFEILESTNPKRPVGSSCDYMQCVEKHQPALGNVKAFVAAASYLRPDDPSINQQGHPNCITPQVMDFVCSDANPLAGRVLPMECVPTMTRGTASKPSREIHVCRWAPAVQAA